MKRFAFLTLIFLATITGLKAEPSVAIRTDAQPREVYIGDPISFGVFITVSSDVAQVPLVLPQPFDAFELLAVSSPTMRIEKDGKRTTVTQFLITTFSTGALTIPSLPIHFSTLSGLSTEGKTEAIPIKVKSLLEEKGDEGNLRPLKGLFNFKSYLWLWILLGVLIAAAAGFGLWKWLNKKKMGDIVPSGPPRPPEEWAWEAIHELEDADLITKGQSKEFYDRLSIITREYLERRYGLSALDRTTAELIAEFRRQNFPMMITQMCRAFLDNADLVKFAKFTPTVDEINTDLNQVKQFINMTTISKSDAVSKEEKVVL